MDGEAEPAPQRPFLSNRVSEAQSASLLCLESGGCSGRVKAAQCVRHHHTHRYRTPPIPSCSRAFDGPRPSPLLAPHPRSRVLRAQRGGTAPAAPSVSRCKLARQHLADWDAARREVDGGQPRPYCPLPCVLLPLVNGAEPGPRLLLRSGAQSLDRLVHN